MPIVEKSVLIERTQAQMFALVDAVESYPEFLPWCGGTQLHERTPTLTVATLHLSYGGVRSRWSTQNTKEEPHLMHIQLREGPFKRMEGHWRFSALGDTACKVEFYLHYDFSSPLLARVMGPVFNSVAETLVESFVKRAQEIHG